jgi:hypothetical protein
LYPERNTWSSTNRRAARYGVPPKTSAIYDRPPTAPQPACAATIQPSSFRHEKPCFETSRVTGRTRSRDRRATPSETVRKLPPSRDFLSDLTPPISWITIPSGKVSGDLVPPEPEPRLSKTDCPMIVTREQNTV